jgi:hypothetical protein
VWRGPWSFLGGGLGCDAELTAEARSSDDYSGGELGTWVRTVSDMVELQGLGMVRLIECGVVIAGQRWANWPMVVMRWLCTVKWVS